MKKGRSREKEAYAGGSVRPPPRAPGPLSRSPTTSPAPPHYETRPRKSPARPETALCPDIHRRTRSAPIGPGGAVAEPRHSRTRPHPNPAEDSTRHTDPAPPPLARKAQCTYRCVVLPDIDLPGAEGYVAKSQCTYRCVVLPDRKLDTFVYHEAKSQCTYRCVVLPDL